jgi:hypothetical protein
VDLYHIWCDLKPGVMDLDFCRAVDAYLGRLRDQGAIAGYRLTRCKLGLRFDALAEFHIMIETRDMAQLESAFQTVASRAGAIEGLHFGANSLVQNVRFALYRDFPDAVRQEGEEKF